MIFVATRVPFPPVTGHYLRTYNIVRGLACDYHVHFFGFHDPAATEAQASAAVAAMGEFCLSVHAERIPAELSRLRLAWDMLRASVRGLPFIAVKYHTRSMRAAIDAALLGEDIAVVHADSLPSAEYLRGLRRPALLTNHNVEHVRLARLAEEQRSWLMRVFLRWQARLTLRYERAVIRELGHCVAVSEEDRATLKETVGDASYFVVPNGADASQPLLPPCSSARPIALWVGGMNDPYNREGVLYFLREIHPRILRQMPAFRWRVVGKDPPQELVSASLEPERGIEIAGFVEDIRAEYARAAIVIVPLTAGAGTKLKVLEAMAFGRAVVTTPVGAEGIGGRDGVELEIAANSEEFAARTIRLLQDSQRRASLCVAARRLVEEKYDWGVVNGMMSRAVGATIERHARCAA